MPCLVSDGAEFDAAQKWSGVGGNQGEKEVTNVLFSITFLLFSNLKHVVVVVVFRYLCSPICGVC